MAEIASFLSILVAILLGAVSPGPSFVFVSRTAVSSRQRDALLAAIGMGLGGALFGAMALAGLTAVLHRVEWAYPLIKLAGGLYLIYLGTRIWLSAAQPVHSDNSGTLQALPACQTLVRACLTQLSNPKTAVVYASLFATILPENPSTWLLIALPPAIFVVEAGWYALVAIGFFGR